MVYIGFEDLLPFPLLQWPLPGLLLGMEPLKDGFFGAMERKTGLSKWPILSRIVAAQFRRFGLAALAYDFCRFVSWPLLRPLTFCKPHRPK
jgi:hypothetical protein